MIDTSSIIVAIIAAVPPTIVAVTAIRKVDQIHVQINSRMDELLNTSGREQRLLGAEDERVAERGRDDAIRIRNDQP